VSTPLSTAAGDAPYRQALPTDAPRLLRLQASYYSEDAYPFDEAVASEVWRALLSDGRLGGAWVAEADSELVAYVVVTLVYGLEHGGRNAVVDELYVSPRWRGRGLGLRALSVVDSACLRLGVRAVHLEVENSKVRARSLCRRCGFTNSGRIVMTKRLEPS
jgi:GNAT superfamily N-acetyltransferase